MASTQRNLDFVLEQLALEGVTSRKMFGEYAIYYRERIVALFCDDQLFIKPTNAGRAFIGKVSEGAPYPGAKPWFFINGDRCEDGEWLAELVRRTASELPPPKPKKLSIKRSTSASSKSAKPSPKSAKPSPKSAKPPNIVTKTDHARTASGRRIETKKVRSDVKGARSGSPYHTPSADRSTRSDQRNVPSSKRIETARSHARKTKKTTPKRRA